MSYVTVDAPRLDGGNVPQTVVAATAPIAYVRFHGRNAATWNVRGGGAAAALRPPLRARTSSRSGSSRCASSPARREQAYAFFNNNNQTNGVAQAPAGAELLRKLLEEDDVPVA